MPILMMPVRLETRFKTVRRPGAAPVDAAVGAHLSRRLLDRLLRPDAHRRPRSRNAQRLLDRDLAGRRHRGPGTRRLARPGDRPRLRARGVDRRSSTSPSNLAAKPTKPRPHDVILTIATDTPLAAAEAAAIAAFWRAVWLADGDAGADGRRARRARGRRRCRPRRRDRRQYVPVELRRAARRRARRSRRHRQRRRSSCCPTVDTKQSAWSQRAEGRRSCPTASCSSATRQPTTRPGRGPRQPGALAAVARPRSVGAQADQLQHDDDGNLVVPDELQWMSDFDRAVEVGMGLRIDLDADQAAARLRRVLVVGLRLERRRAGGARPSSRRCCGTTPSRRTGLAVVPQGTPTNNTDASAPGTAASTTPTRASTICKAPLVHAGRPTGSTSATASGSPSTSASTRRCSTTRTPPARPTSSRRAP